MLDSTDLMASSKATKRFHHNKPLREAQPAPGTSQAQRQPTFATHDKAREWSSAGNFSPLFSMPETPDQGGGGQTEYAQALGAGTSIAEAQGRDGKAIPPWCVHVRLLSFLYSLYIC